MQVIATATRDVDLACMELLVTLCTETKLGRNAVSDAELCKACIDFASDLLRCLTTKLEIMLSQMNQVLINLYLQLFFLPQSAS